MDAAAGMIPLQTGPLYDCKSGTLGMTAFTYEDRISATQAAELN
jgi:hypothetical protein